MECTAKKEKVTTERFSITLDFESEREASVFHALFFLATIVHGPMSNSSPKDYLLIASKIDAACTKAWKR